MKSIQKYTLRNRMNTVVEAVGLIISFTVFIILMSQVWYDVTFDTQWPGSGRIYVFERPQSRTSELSPYENLLNRPQISSIREASPEVEAVGTMSETVLFDMESREPIESVTAILVDTDFTKIFPFRMVAGSMKGFERPESVVLTESTAAVLFGDAPSAVGEQVLIVKEDFLEATVIGVCRDFPVNSSLAEIDVIGQIGDLSVGNNDPNYESNNAFVKLRKGANPKEVAPLLGRAFVSNWVLWESSDTPPDIRERTVRESRLVSLHATHYDAFAFGTGNRTRNAVLTVIAILFLLVGLLNVFNLTNAGLSFRIHDNGVRMVFGAGKGRILAGDLVRAAMLCLVSYAIALVVVFSLSNSKLASLLTVPLRPSAILPVLVACLVAALLGSLLAVLIPSMHACSYAPANVLKGRINLFGRGKTVRIVTLVLQFLLTFVFLEIALMIGVQSRHLDNIRLGFETQDIVDVYMGYFPAMKAPTVRDELMRDGAITDLAFCNVFLVDNNHRLQRRSEGVDVSFYGMDVSYNYLDMFGFDLAEGRGFRLEDGIAATGAFVVNEAFRRAYPDVGIGSRMKGIRTGNNNTDAEIVGVVKDFHFQNLQRAIEPFAFYCSGEPDIPGNPRYFRMSVRTVQGMAGEVAGKLPELLNEIGGGEKSASCEVLATKARKLYGGNEAENALVRISSILSLLLALLGVFGLDYLEARTIRRSVAIRKVMGAMTPDLIRMMLKKYLLLNTVAFVASIPLGILTIERWLQQFSDKAPVPVWIFVLSWFLVSAITAGVISAMALHVARTNPAVELKKE